MFAFKCYSYKFHTLSYFKTPKFANLIFIDFIFFCTKASLVASVLQKKRSTVFSLLIFVAVFLSKQVFWNSISNN